MPSKLEIMTQTMLSLKSDQNNVMNNINAILNNRDSVEGAISKIKKYLSELSSIHAQMQECESFIVQLSPKINNDEESAMGSTGEVNVNNVSEK